MSCKAIIDKCLYKGAITEKEHAKLLRNLKLEVVRCKDCRFFDTGGAWAYCILVCNITNENGFCHRAERKKE